MKTLTIFTPVYNRAALVGELYESLCSQTCDDFEWLVVDDGSTDGTADALDRMVREGRLDMRVVTQPNGGKHTAINHGAALAQGELFFIVDSDDRLVPDAVRWILETYAPLRGRRDFCGLSGTRVRPDGTSISSPERRFGTVDATPFDIRAVNGVPGDLAEVWLTDVLRRHPFPVFEGEKFCSEGLVWMRLAREGLKVRYCDRGIYVCEYRPGGLTDNSVRTRMLSPRAATLTYAEFAAMPGSWKWRLRHGANYWRFRGCLPRGAAPGAPAPGGLWWMRPLGLLMHLHDRRTAKI